MRNPTVIVPQTVFWPIFGPNFFKKYLNFTLFLKNFAKK